MSKGVQSAVQANCLVGAVPCPRGFRLEARGNGRPFGDAIRLSPQSRRAYLGTFENTWANHQKADVVENYEKPFHRPFTGSKATSGYTYVLTEVEEGGDDGAGLVGLNMNSGHVEHQGLLKLNEPDCDVDELTGRIFNLRDKKEIPASSVR